MEPLKVPPSSEEVGEKAESVSSTPDHGKVVEAYPVVDAGHCSTGHWEGDGTSVKFVEH